MPSVTYGKSPMAAGMGSFRALRAVRNGRSEESAPLLWWLWIAFASAGLCYGVLESAVRVDYMKMMTEEDAGQRFALLAVVERASGVIGPALWIVPFWIISNEASANVGSMVLMASLPVICALMLRVSRYGRAT